MRTHINFLIILWILPASQCLAQRETYGHTTYTPPRGWIKTPNQGWMGYHLEDKAKNAFCQMRVYEGFAQEGNPQVNFAHFWRQIVAEPYQVGAKPETQTEAKDGWSIITGSSQVTYEGYPYAALLMVVTGYGVTVPYFFLYDNERFVADIGRFADGLEIKKLAPAGQSGNQPQNAPSQAQNLPSKGVGGAVIKGISKPTTNFDDGWVANAQADFVLAKKGNVELRVYYPDKVLNEARPNTVTEAQHYLQAYLNPTYQVETANKWSGVEYPPIDYISGTATHRQTGGQVHYAICAPGGFGGAIVAVAPDQNSLQRVFPATHPRALERMVGYNKFAIAAQDLVGTWVINGGGSANYYNVYTGASAGYAATSSTRTYVFNPDGSYQFSFSGASTSVGGSTSFSGVKYNGQFAATDWGMTATNQHGGKTAKFQAHFKAVKGGVVLFLVDENNYDYVYVKVK
jgi:hypothetical protein